MDEVARRPVDEAVDALREAGGDDGPPVWGSFGGRYGDLDRLVVHPEPADLTGATAPADVWAVGILAGATARTLDDGTVTGRGRLCCVVTRHGEVGAHLTVPGGKVVREPPSSGRMLDVLHRCLALATPPAELPVATGLGVAWMADLGDAGSNWGPLTWDECLALHPAWPAVVRPTSLSGVHRGGSDLVEVVRGWDWEEVRRRCGDGRLALPGVPAALAGWMDGGMVCRWMLDGVRDADLLERARRAVAPWDWQEVLRVALGDFAPDEHPTPTGPGRRRRAGR